MFIKSIIAIFFLTYSYINAMATEILSDTVIHQIAAKYNFADSGKKITRYKLMSKTTSKVLYGSKIIREPNGNKKCTRLYISLDQATKGYKPKKIASLCDDTDVKEKGLTYESLITTVVGVGKCENLGNKMGVSTFNHDGTFGTSQIIRKEVLCIDM